MAGTKSLDASHAIFKEKGYGGLNIRNIAERIEYSPATIYLYYKDKNEIFYAHGLVSLFVRERMRMYPEEQREELAKRSFAMMAKMAAFDKQVNVVLGGREDFDGANWHSSAHSTVTVAGRSWESWGSKGCAWWPLTRTGRLSVFGVWSS